MLGVIHGEVRRRTKILNGQSYRSLCFLLYCIALGYTAWAAAVHIGHHMKVCALRTGFVRRVHVSRVPDRRSKSAACLAQQGRTSKKLTVPEPEEVGMLTRVSAWCGCEGVCVCQAAESGIARRFSHGADAWAECNWSSPRASARAGDGLVFPLGECPQTGRQRLWSVHESLPLSCGSPAHLHSLLCT